MYQRRDGDLYCEDVSLRAIAREVGTAFYIYSWQSIESKLGEFRRGLGATKSLICYAVKANSNLTLLRKLAVEGIGADVVSRGELEKSLVAGIPPAKIVFSGVGKTDEELRRACELGLYSIHVESLEEITRLGQIAKRPVSIALRINPNIPVETNPYIATGLHENKFGIPEDGLATAADLIRQYPSLQWKGLSCHIGSQILNIAPFEEALTRLRLKAQGLKLEHIDLGGGLGVRYELSETPPSITDYCAALSKKLAGTNLTLVLEPGRSLVAEAGGLVCKVLGVKQTPKKRFVIVDAAMNDLIRPSLYGAYHAIEPVAAPAKELEKVDVVGPVCETGDFLATDRMLPTVNTGDLLFIANVGAYGASMASNYNLRPCLPEVLVEGARFAVIRRREKTEEMWRLEIEDLVWIQ